MKFKTLILLLLVVVLPTALLSWGGLQLAREQSDQFENRVRELMKDQLVELDTRIQRYFTLQEAALQKTTGLPLDSIDTIRDAADSVGLIDNIFVITENDILAYPNPISPLNERELEFYGRIKAIVEDGEIQNQVLKAKPTNRKAASPPSAKKIEYQESNAEDSEEVNSESQSTGDANLPNQQELEQSEPANRENSPGNAQSTQPQRQRRQQSVGDASSDDQGNLYSNRMIPQLGRRNDNNNSNAQANRLNMSPIPAFSNVVEANQKTYEVCEGWFVWYWGRGVNLIFWQRIINGDIICIALERSRWMSDLIAELPDTLMTKDRKEGEQNRTTQIVNSSGETVYQWGNPVKDEMILAAELPVSYPLTSWKLQMWVSPGELKSDSFVGWNIVVGIVAFSIALIAVVAIFFREYKKELDEASKRVSFVNQVSHELRTPLTNIRMYAELLNQDLNDLQTTDSDKVRKRVGIVEAESNRLSRLISNVLSFAGHQKGKLSVRYSEGIVDDCIQCVLSNFSPHLEKLGIEIRTDLQANQPSRFDADAVEQIIGNLVSNVEKYAAEGDFVEVKTRQSNGIVEVTIRDDGCGIAAEYSQKIFEPFWRLSNQLQHASGTGIGLSISREIAVMHGGDLLLRPSAKGACFTLRIKTE